MVLEPMDPQNGISHWLCLLPLVQYQYSITVCYCNISSPWKLLVVPHESSANNSVLSLFSHWHSFELADLHMGGSGLWSCGWLCDRYTLLVGKPPFETSCLKDTYTKIKKNEYHIPVSRMSPPAKRLIERLLQADPTQRPTMEQVLHDEFFTAGSAFSFRLPSLNCVLLIIVSFLYDSILCSCIA